jgi:hypothetical protein
MQTTTLEPDGRTAGDRELVLVPVRSGRCGSTAVRTGRLPDGRRVGLAFSSPAALAEVFGPDQEWIPLNVRVARAMFVDAGAPEMRVDAHLVPVPGPVTSLPDRASVAIAPKPLVALRALAAADRPAAQAASRRRAGARIRLAARHAH